MRVNPCIGAQLSATAHRQPTYSSHHHHPYHCHDHRHHHDYDHRHHRFYRHYDFNDFDDRDRLGNKMLKYMECLHILGRL